MKTGYWIVCILIFALASCKKENRWISEQPEKQISLNYTDISKDFFDTQIPFDTLSVKYPFFFDSDTPAEIWEAQRRDTLEMAIYDSINKVFGDGKYKNELNKMFSYFQTYFPQEQLPHIFTYSSGLQNIYEDAVMWGRQERVLFIALDGFLGSHSDFYKMEKVYPYMAQSMNPENLTPKVVYALAQQVVPFNPRQQSFIDLMIDEGKKLMLADAFLPNTTDELKIGYTKEQLEWSKANEEEIWNYFVEGNLIFSNDKSTRERFLDPAPFSKFQNEIETESPGRIGAWIGWQICRKYMNDHPEMKLIDFLNTDNQTIFKESKYKPKK